MSSILVGLDGSPRQPSVLAAAVRLAQRLDARLWLYRAVGLPVEVPAQAFSMDPAALGPFLVDRARKELLETARTIPPGLFGGALATLAMPWQGILAAARECDASMVVIGSHGYGVLDRLLGTTAAKVVNHADRTVVVVRAAEQLGAVLHPAPANA